MYGIFLIRQKPELRARARASRGLDNISEPGLIIARGDRAGLMVVQCPFEDEGIYFLSREKVCLCDKVDGGLKGSIIFFAFFVSFASELWLYNSTVFSCGLTM